MIYVDNAGVLKHGYAWSHLVADSIQELHEFAARIGLPSRAFHRNARHPHYDITARQRQHAIRHGAMSITAREAVRIGLRAALPSHAVAAAPGQLHLFA